MSHQYKKVPAGVLISRLPKIHTGGSAKCLLRQNIGQRTYASVLLGRGVPIKEVSENLGHADVAFTLWIYTHCMPGFRDKAATEMEAAFADADKAQREKEEKENRNGAQKLPAGPGAAPGAATAENDAIQAVVN